MVKFLETLMIPISFMLAGCDMGNMVRAWKTIIRNINPISMALGTFGACVYIWIISSAGNKYEEYLALLGCDIGVPNSPMVEEFKHADILTQILMFCLLRRLYDTSFDNLFKKLPLRLRSRLRPRRGHCCSAAKTGRHFPRVTSRSGKKMKGRSVNIESKPLRSLKKESFNSPPHPERNPDKLQVVSTPGTDT